MEVLSDMSCGNEKEQTMTSKWSVVAHLALWGTIILQWLTIRDLNQRINNEKKWSEFWHEAWLKERSRR